MKLCLLCGGLFNAAEWKDVDIFNLAAGEPRARASPGRHASFRPYTTYIGSEPPNMGLAGGERSRTWGGENPGV